MKKILLPVGVLLLIAFAGWRVWHHNPIATQPLKAKDTTKTPAPTPPPNNFNKTQYSVDQPGSLWWIVNKKRPLPANYIPPDLTVPNVSLRLSAGSEQMHLGTVAASALPSLFNAAKNAGYPLTLASGYRSIAYQTQLYNGYVKTDGLAAADRYSAKPGTSEHQTGLAMDVCIAGSNCALEQSFGATTTGKWLAEHAHEYGFIVRYLNGKESVTGYEYEPWHIRYVGTDLATELFAKGLTMEEFFGVSG